MENYSIKENEYATEHDAKIYGTHYLYIAEFGLNKLHELRCWLGLGHIDYDGCLQCKQKEIHKF